MVTVKEKAVLKKESIREEPHVILQNLIYAEETLIKEKKQLGIC